MRPGGGKSKGAAFERKVCKQLSLWVSRGKRADLFWRSAMSGGRATVQHRKGISNQSQVADISAVDPMGAALLRQFAIECKFVKTLKLDMLLLKGRSPFNGYWRQAVHQARRVHRHPLLIAKQNGSPEIVVTSVVGAEMLKLALGWERARFVHYHEQAVVGSFKELLRTECPFSPEESHG